MAQPASALVSTFNRIINELNGLVKRKESEFTKTRILLELEAQAKDLQSLSLAYSFSALGSIAAARMDIVKMRHNHKVSMQYGEDIMLAKNYAVSMRVCGLWDDALAYGEALTAANPDDPSLVDFLARLTFDMANEKKYRHYAQRFTAMTGQEHEHWRAFQAEMDEIDDLGKACFAATALACDAQGS